MTIADEQAMASAGVYVVDATPRARALNAAEVSRIAFVKEIAAAYFFVNAIRLGLTIIIILIIRILLLLLLL